MSDIYNIIDKQKLDIVNKPISEAHELPNECYTSKEYTLIERKKLFEDKYHFLKMDISRNSIPPRQGSELWVEMKKKN